MKKVFLILVFVAFVTPAFADRVISVADGDTLTVLRDGRPLKIRLGNIDAPEQQQAFGQQSKQSLSDLCYGKDAVYSIQNVDSYGRSVALVKCAGVDVNRVQVERGMAWVYTQYNNDHSLLSLQAKAKAAERGLWIEKKAIAPWTFRHSNQHVNEAQKIPTGALAPRFGR